MRESSSYNGMSYVLDAPYDFFNRRRPLVVVLHGGGGGGQQVEWQSNMYSAIRAEKFIALYPYGIPFGIGHFWNASPNAKDEKLAQANHVRMLDNLVNHIRTKCKISQVFTCGISNGAHMAYKWASESYTVRGIGAIAGQRAVGQYMDVPKRGIPLIHFHGRLDTFNPIDGGQSNEQQSAFETYEIYSLSDCIGSWVRHNQLNDSKLSRNKPDILCTSWGGINPISRIILENGGHTWPGGKVSKFESDNGVGPLVDFPASQLMLQFFQSV